MNPSKKGQAVTLTATIAPGAGVTGSVTFKDGATVLGTAAVNATTHKAAITKSTRPSESSGATTAPIFGVHWIFDATGGEEVGKAIAVKTIAAF